MRRASRLLPLWAAAITVASAGFAVPACAAEAALPPFNVVVFTTDDMDFSSVNANGNPIPWLTPHIDRLAAGGMVFERAHVPSAVCQPSRQSMMTGLHPHRNGSFGFQLPTPGTPNLSELLMASGWLTASFSKGRDYASSKWTMFQDGHGTAGFSREPARFAADVEKAIQRAQGEGKRFFLNVPTSDPHRVYPGSRDEADELTEMKRRWPEAERQGKVYFPPFHVPCTPEQAWVPPYLPDLPAIREEWAQYYAGVHRADEALGRVLDALRAAGVEDETVVIFYNDNGASFPTSKQNVYPYSTQCSLIIRWPGVTRPGSRDREHFVSTMDLLPTLLEAAGLPLPERLDGRSLLPLLRGEPQGGRAVLMTTQNFYKPGFQVYPMRALHTADFTYIFNAWADGRTRFDGECHSGLTFAAMIEAAKTDPAIAERVRHITLRAPEDLYDVRADPWCLRNLAAEPAQAAVRARLRAELEAEMRRTDDPLLPALLGTGPVPPEWRVAVRTD
jgi:N-sulfoglucosamine sulfohydrolase